MHSIPGAWGCRAYVSVWQDEKALCMKPVAVFHISSPPLFSTVYQWNACLLQDLLGTQLCKAVVSKNNLVSVDLSKHSCFLIEKTTNQTEPQETR